MVEREKLEACPFCGENDANLHQRPVGPMNSEGYWVECENCGNKTSYRAKPEIAIAAWNRRTLLAEAGTPT